MRIFLLATSLAIVSNFLGQKEFYLKFYDVQTNEIISPSKIELSTYDKKACFEHTTNNSTFRIKGLKKKNMLCYSRIDSKAMSCSSTKEYKRKDTTNIYTAPPRELMDLRWISDSINLVNRIINDTLDINNDQDMLKVLSEHISIPEYIYQVSKCFDVSIYISISINTDGIVESYKIVKGFEKHLDREILKDLWNMPIMRIKNNELKETEINIPIRIKWN